MKRLFAAIKVHPGEQFMTVLNGLKAGCQFDRVTWVDPANIHITLKFFGETEEYRIPGLIARLQEIASRYHPFDIQLSGTGVFGSSYQPRVVWIGIEKNPSITGLGQAVVDEMENLGFEKDRQHFVPHLTLGRIKYIDNKRRFSDLILKYKDLRITTVKVSEFHLIESQLSSKGPTYTILETFGLTNEEHLSEE